MQQMESRTFTTAGGALVQRKVRSLAYQEAGEGIADALDSRLGALFGSSYEFPGRYRRWDIGFLHPPLRVIAWGRRVVLEALNLRGEVLLAPLASRLRQCEAVARAELLERRLELVLKPAQPVLFEEERSRRFTVFSVLRELLGFFRNGQDRYLGLYGAFGYELAFQFDEVRPCLARDPQARDLVLYLPDEIVVIDHQKEQAFQCSYDFFLNGRSTSGLPREGAREPFRKAGKPPARECDHHPGEYAETVRKAQEYFRRGELFEAVPGQTFFTPCRDAPSAVFQRLKTRNPSPYGALLNLGEGEYLVAASPEMFVRVEGGRVETCPISGTIARGRDAIEDAEQIRTLLNSEKDLAELSMCTDVDRNDKARVCLPESIRVIGRRQIELYSRLIHTVDHVEGRLKPGFDALDAFLSHAWAVTVTGAPKQAAIQFIEDHERTPRRWYGGALGYLAFNGDLNTGLTLRTVRIAGGVAEIRVGATLLYDSEPEAEEAETRLKASALLDAVRNAGGGQSYVPATLRSTRSAGRVLMVDHRDSFVHTLSSYFQACGAEVATVRFDRFPQALEAFAPQLVVLSPGPGRPDDFGMRRTIARVLERELPLFGICLGLQGIVEYFGGSLRLLDYPMHGKTSLLERYEGRLFEGLRGELRVGRYHSLVAGRVPECLKVSASTAGVVMAVEHGCLPVSAVQFHPESILSMHGESGRKMIQNVLEAAFQPTGMVQIGH